MSLLLIRMTNGSTAQAISSYNENESTGLEFFGDNYRRQISNDLLEMLKILHDFNFNIFSGFEKSGN